MAGDRSGREFGTKSARKSSRYESTDGESRRPKGLLKEFFYDLNPLNEDEWKNSNRFVKTILVVRAPPMLLLQLLIPVVNETAEKRGWSKLLNCLQLTITPCLALVKLNGKRHFDS